MILHAREHDQTIAWRFNPVMEDLEPGCAQIPDLGFHQVLGRLSQRSLDFTNADGSCAFDRHALFADHLPEEMGFA